MTVAAPTEEDVKMIDEFLDVPVAAVKAPSQEQLDRLDNALTRSPFWTND